MKKLIALIFATSLFACAHAPVRLDREHADATAAVKDAETSGAAHHPQASIHLKYARERLSTADRLLEDGEGVAAKRALEEAIVDGQLASRMMQEQELLAQMERAKERAQEIEAQARAEASAEEGDEP